MTTDSLMMMYCTNVSDEQLVRYGLTTVRIELLSYIPPTHTIVLRPFFWDHPGEPVPVSE